MYIGFWLFVLQPGSLCSEKSGQHKTPSGMTVDHRNMLRRTQTLTYTVSITEIECTSQSIGKGWIQSDVLTFFPLGDHQLSRQWTWLTSRNATHRTPRSPSPQDGPSTFFFFLHLSSLRTFPLTSEVSPICQSWGRMPNNFLWTLNHSKPSSFFTPEKWWRRDQLIKNLSWIMLKSTQPF